MGRKADRIAALEALLATAERERDAARSAAQVWQRRAEKAEARPSSLMDRVRDEIGDRVGWLRDAMGLGL